MTYNLKSCIILTINLTLKSEYTEDMLDKITVEYGNNTSKTLGIEVKNGDTREANNIFVDGISRNL